MSILLGKHVGIKSWCGAAIDSRSPRRRSDAARHHLNLPYVVVSLGLCLACFKPKSFLLARQLLCADLPRPSDPRFKANEVFQRPGRTPGERGRRRRIFKSQQALVFISPAVKLFLNALRALVISSSCDICYAAASSRCTRADRH